MEYATACLFPSVDKNWRGVQFVPHTEFSSGPRSQTSSPFPQILELKSQNHDFNSLLCEIFTNLAVKTQKLQTQRIIYGRQNLFDSYVNQGIHHDTCIFCNCLFRMVTCGYFHFGIGTSIRQPQLANLQFAKNAKCKSV